MTNGRPFRTPFIATLAFILLAGCAPKPSSRITLALNWFPEVEHGGYYAAQEHGFFRDEGLDVDILSGGPDTPVISRVASGAATFGVENADNIIFARAEGAPVTALLAPIQTSPRCIMVHEESGITNFAGLVNLTLAMSPRGAFSHFLRAHAPLTGVKIVPYPGNVSQFLINDRYAQQAYVFSEPFIARQKGAHPSVLMLADIGFNPYTSVLVARDPLVREQPELVAKFVKACVRGWRRYAADPDPTNRTITRLNPEMGLPILSYGAQALRPLTPNEALGTMTRERWSELLAQMVELQLVKSNAVAVESLYTTQFF